MLVSEFADITGHQWRITQQDRYGYKTYDQYYPTTGQYYGMYGAGYGFDFNTYDILETGAEFCAAFATMNAGRVDLAQGVISKNIPIDQMLPRITNNQNAKQWVETYMLNPRLKPYFTPEDIASLQVTDVTVADINVTESAYRVYDNNQQIDLTLPQMSCVVSYAPPQNLPTT